MIGLKKCIIAFILLVTLASTSALRAEWIEDGVSIYNLSNTPYDKGIVSDGAGGCIIVWKDYRVGTDIYAQRVDKYGTLLWTANGVAVCSQINSESVNIRSILFISVNQGLGTLKASNSPNPIFIPA